jgi:hypothetical protein
VGELTKNANSLGGCYKLHFAPFWDLAVVHSSDGA